MEQTNVTIRLITRDESAEYAILQHKVFDYDEGEIGIRINTYIGKCIGAFVNGKLVGGQTILRMFDGRFYADAIFVDSEYRKCGIGKMLFDAMLDIVGNEPLVFITTKNDEWKLEWYMRKGFRITDKMDFWGDGTITLEMTRV